ncbi:endo alpha-1,4 polygalactosaminidase [Kutzneria viridogrisea]|uniref:Glycoside-hydrolase family GH114 TIM-barrel domain-containing protein n=2 Tax=Kutzneria TaxID=43356 RepID=A0ABR6BKL3_9PSEU|nr:endo alpha-1,4 polygalactosaminidase [Kutzneria albida]AHH95440.1 putative endo alpha-1,4 polygalactosaminidase [Kutzneria albida DSM 43870]MBA8927201.1 hypothetical protein [Kutzneria viridogrisea]
MRARALCVLLPLVVLAAGCSGSGGEPPAPTSTTTTGSGTTEESSSTTATPAPPTSTDPSATKPPTAAPPTKPSTGGGTSARWVPAPGTAWQWQLTTPVDTSVDVPVYDIDGVEATADVIRTLHAKGRKVICYVNAGANEDFRPDAKAFPSSLQGRSNNWPGEKWLDIRQLSVLQPLMAKRFDTCRDKGFDGIEADLVDGYASDTGFPLSAADQLAYNRMLARLAHDRGLSIGLKNDLDQVTQLVGEFDFSVNEQCAQYNECPKLSPFIAAGKAVFQVEYELDNKEFCGTTSRLRFSSMRKNKSLDAARWPC